MFFRSSFWLLSAAVSLIFIIALAGTSVFSLLLSLSENSKKPDNSIHELSTQKRLGQSLWIYALAISPDRTKLAVGNYSGEIKIWNLESQSLVHTLTGHTDAVESLSFSQDSQRLVSGSWDNDVRLWNLSKAVPKSKVLRGHKDDVQAVSISQDGQMVISGSYDGAIKIWNLNSEKAVRTWQNNHSLSALVLHSNNKVAVSGDVSGELKIWNLKSGRILQSASGHSGEIRSIAFSPDGRTLVSGSYDKTIKLWHFDRKLALSRTLDGGPSTATLSVAISPDGQTLASGGHDGSICLWETDTGKLSKMLEGHSGPVWSVAFGIDGKQLVSSGSDTTVRLWPLSDISPISRRSMNVVKAQERLIITK